MNKLTEILDKMLDECKGENVKDYAFLCSKDFEQYGVTEYKGYKVYYMNILKKETIRFQITPFA